MKKCLFSVAKLCLRSCVCVLFLINLFIFAFIISVRVKTALLFFMVNYIANIYMGVGNVCVLCPFMRQHLAYV